MMPSHEQMVATIRAYVEGFARQDVEAIVRLYAPDATVEDPVGSPPLAGVEAIRTFYSMAVQTGAKLTLSGPVRTAANSAAFAFSVHVAAAEPPRRIDVIDTFTFNSNGQIGAMRAFWGPENVHNA